MRVRARLAIRRLFYALFTVVGLVRWLVQRRAVPTLDPREILIVRVDLLGDVLFCLPAAQALRARHPSARITMLTLPYTAAIARMSPAIDEVACVDTNRVRSPRGLFDPRTWNSYWRIWRYLRLRRFDLAVSMYGRMGSLCAFLSGARRTVGYAAEAYPLLLTDPVPGGRHSQAVHEVDYALRLAAYCGAPSIDERPALIIPESARNQAGRLLSSRGISPAEQLAVIHAGSVNGSAKRWPPGRWAAFADRLTQRTGAHILLVGAESDRPVAEEVLQSATSSLVSLVGQTDLQELAAILARADLFAGGDSGPLHLAAALGRRVLAVYGPTDPRIYGPQPEWTRSIVHRADIPCSPCYTLAATAECPLADPICMRLVTVDEMVQDAIRLLENGPTPPLG